MTEPRDPLPALPQQRRQHILDLISRSGSVRVAELVEALAVSEMTVRRDIGDLAALGQLTRVHGGAVAAAASFEPPFAAKVEQFAAQKAAIGSLAAGRVRPGDSLILSAGSTTLEVARALASLPHASTLTIITNSLPAADALAPAAGDHHSAQGALVVLTGGQRTRSDALVGPLAVDALRSVRVQWAFLGAHAVDPGLGLMTPNLDEAQVNAAIVAAAASVVAVVDHTKWNAVGLRSFCPIDRLDVLITDDEASAESIAALEERGVVVERAAPE